ncbi:MAG TPA: acetamidase/formamidase family protein [Chloroflexota bacterium]
MQRILPSPSTVHWGYFDSRLPPIASVRSGEVIFLRSVSGAPDDDVASTSLPPEIPAIYAEVNLRGPGPHILTGPVYVTGARPGAVLQVDLLSIVLGADYGYTGLRPTKGLFPERVLQAEREIILLDRQNGSARLQSGFTLRTAPFFGILGVAPPLERGRVDSAPPGCHGGNIDNKELCAGTTLFLPVWVDGALFSAGDGHAAQGDGEVTINAIETCLEGTFRLQSRDDFSLLLPIAVTPTHLITMGFDEDLDQAARIAVQALLDLLERYYGLSWADAYRLTSLAANLRVTQVVNGAKGIHVMINRALLAQRHCHPPFLDGVAASPFGL